MLLSCCDQTNTTKKLAARKLEQIEAKAHRTITSNRPSPYPAHTHANSHTHRHTHTHKHARKHARTHAGRQAGRQAGTHPKPEKKTLRSRRNYTIMKMDIPVSRDVSLVYGSRLQ